MSGQASLLVPEHVVRRLDPVYPTVTVIDGRYHRHAANIHGPDPHFPGRRDGVVGFRMRCGAEHFPPLYSQFEGRLTAEKAQQIAEPCTGCFPTEVQAP